MVLENVKVGDQLTRILGHSVPMCVVVGEVTDTTIKCGSCDGFIPWEVGWTFSRETGGEIDEGLGWDGVKTTGSYILK